MAAPSLRNLVDTLFPEKDLPRTRATSTLGHRLRLREGVHVLMNAPERNISS